MTKEDESLPLRYYISPPATFEEVLARIQVIAAQWIHCGITCQKLVEGHLETTQSSALNTMDKIRRNTLEAALLQAPSKAEVIKLS